ncbi:MAG TPA: hypothetical protein VFH18_03315 [Erysipelotrichaceae bacterium]|nr:hypothetical protein [Erysipelotrichaceae bacterium]
MYFNLLSLIFGFIAIFLPIITFRSRFDKNIISIISLSMVSLAIVFQLVWVESRVIISDWIAVLDTIEVSISISFILLFVTILVNLIVLKQCKVKTFK